MYLPHILIFSALLISSSFACEDTATLPDFPEPRVRTRDMYQSIPLQDPTRAGENGDNNGGEIILAGTMGSGNNGGSNSVIAGMMASGEEYLAGSSPGGMLLPGGGAPPPGGMGGMEVGGMEVGGMEVGGMEVGGMEVGGEQMGGAQMGGELMGGEERPQGTLNCAEVISCFEPCADNDEACVEACLSAGTSSAIDILNAVLACIERNMCMDSDCFSSNCSQERLECYTDGEIQCFSWLDCPGFGPCVNGICVECVESFDCDLGYTCENNACVVMETACDSDFYEPNNSQDTATSSTLSDLITSDEILTLCGADQDFYAVSVCPNGTVNSTVTFDSNIVDIDTAFIFPGLDTPEELSTGFSSQEVMSHTNLSNADQLILLHIFPYRPVSSATYQLSLEFNCP